MYQYLKEGKLIHYFEHSDGKLTLFMHGGISRHDQLGKIPGQDMKVTDKQSLIDWINKINAWKDNQLNIYASTYGKFDDGQCKEIR